MLIVDDDDRLREFVRVNLEVEGYAVREAGERRGGARGARASEPPDLILLDVMMPQVDGWEMLRRVQERHGVGAIPVIMFSGKVDERRRRGATSRGAQGFIGKPFDPQQLIESTKQLAAGLTSWLDRRPRLERWVVHHRVGCARPALRRRSRASGSFGLVWLVIAVVLAAFSWRRPWLCPARRRWPILVAERVLRRCCRQCDRPRPAAAPPTRAGAARPRCRATRSFPSGHAATSFACATMLALAGAALRRRRSSCSPR